MDDIFSGVIKTLDTIQRQHTITLRRLAKTEDALDRLTASEGGVLR